MQKKKKNEYRAKKFQKNNLEKDFFKLISLEFFVKTMENVKKHRDINIVTTKARRNCFVSEPNYQIAEPFSERLLEIK